MGTRATLVEHILGATELAVSLALMQTRYLIIAALVTALFILGAVATWFVLGIV